MQGQDLYRRYVPGSPLFLLGSVFALVVVVGIVSLYLELVSYALLRVGLSHQAVSLALAGIFIGGLIDIPLHRKHLPQPHVAEWITFYHRWGEEPFPIGLLRGNTIAINFGGAIVPLLVALWIVRQISDKPGVLFSLSIASFVSVVACHRLGRIITNVGIVLPGWIAPFIGIAGAWLLLPAGSPHHASFAFVTAVVGPFIGADLMNLKDTHRLGSGTMSIGGAGPLDGIVLSGVLAATLA